MYDHVAHEFKLAWVTENYLREGGEDAVAITLVVDREEALLRHAAFE